MKPLVTLVTPVYNAMPYLKDCLESIVAQTWRPMELIFVNDGSSDDSLACLHAYENILKAADLSVRILDCPHRGQAAAMNAALPFVTGDFFTWCDADDLLASECVEKKARFLMERADIGMVRNNGIVLDADKGIVLNESARESDRCEKYIFEDLFTDRTYCYAGCYMIRTALLFDCYPKKKMPESIEGQNLQLLLPPASRTPCGYLDEKLHTYCRRSSGHSSMERSYRENLIRMKNFTALRLAILEYCDCDHAHFTSLAKDMEEKNKKILLYSAVKRAREELEK